MGRTAQWWNLNIEAYLERVQGVMIEQRVVSGERKGGFQSPLGETCV